MEIIAKQVFLDAQEVVSLVQCGQVDDAMELDRRLRDRIVQTTQKEPAAMLEAMGVVATSLRKAGQKGMALPWYEDLCVLATRLDPYSADTAWDWYYLADCYIACAELAQDPDSSREYKEKAGVAAKMAANAYSASGATSEALMRNINAVKDQAGGPR